MVLNKYKSRSKLILNYVGLKNEEEWENIDIWNCTKNKIYYVFLN